MMRLQGSLSSTTHHAYAWLYTSAETRRPKTNAQMDIHRIIDLPGTAKAQRESFWSGDIDGLANSDWDATWIFPDACFGHLPSRNHARQHEGFSSPSSSPEPQRRDSTARKGNVDVVMPCPSVTLPRPSLDFDFRIGVVFDSTPLAEMGRWKAGAISGGSWTASFGAGTVAVR
jgi:hypothetical protein